MNKNKNKLLSGGGKNLTGGGKCGWRGVEVGGKGEGSGGGRGEVGIGYPPVYPLEYANCFFIANMYFRISIHWISLNEFKSILTPINGYGQP